MLFIAGWKGIQIFVQKILPTNRALMRSMTNMGGDFLLQNLWLDLDYLEECNM